MGNSKINIASTYYIVRRVRMLSYTIFSANFSLSQTFWRICGQTSWRFHCSRFTHVGGANMFQLLL